MDRYRFYKQGVPECYYSLAILQASVDYYMFYETWAGETEPDGVRKHSLKELPFVKSVVDRLNVLMEATYCSVAKEISQDELFALRDEVKSKAMSVATYTDLFKLYEYVLNRAYIKDSAEIKSFNNDAASRDVLSAIFSDSENLVINNNIKLAVSQLPIRMTKSKFFDILHNSLSKYVDADLSTLDRELYMLRSSVGVFPREAEDFPELEEKFLYFEKFDFAGADEVSYKEAEAELLKAVELLTDLSEAFNSLEHIINFLCVVNLCAPYITNDHSREIEVYSALVSEAKEGLEADVRSEMSAEALAGFTSLEGKLEEQFERLKKVQSKSSTYSSDITDEELVEIIRIIDKCERLISSSAFADLEDEEVVNLTAEAVDEKVSILKDELASQFASDSKLMQRARMAAVLSQLPVFFNSRTDVMNYVRDSFDGCRDNYEKAVSLRLILDTVNSNNM